MFEKLYFRQKFLYLINFLLIINQLTKVSSQDCEIRVPDSVTSQKLDKIICIGPSGFANPNFGLFSNGSLIIESSKSNQRAFYGITQEGKPYFENNEYSIFFNASSGETRNQAENFVITINDGTYREYLLSVGYLSNSEIYDLNQKKIISIVDTKTFVGNQVMDCLIQSGINFYDGNNYYFYYIFITVDFDFNIKKLIFPSFDITQVSLAKSNGLRYIRGKVSSCYMTDNKYIICIILRSSSWTSSNVYAVIYDKNLEQKLITKLGDYTVAASALSFPYFLKCLHLKEEIGVFTFYKTDSSGKMSKYPILLFQKYINSHMEEYISPLNLNKKEFNTENVYNDFIKVNKNKLCFISTSVNKDEMYIVIINIINNSTTAVRYYFFNILSLYSFKFYSSIRAQLYNNYISFAFSFCKSSSSDFYPGLILFSYPNGVDYNLDIIDMMITRNEIINSHIINLREKVKIDNNIFGLKYDKINIKQFSNCNPIEFVSSLMDGVNIIDNYNLTNTENIIAKNIPLRKIKCSIGYTYIITEPSFEEYNSIASDKVFPDTYNEEYFNQEKDNYESRLLYYNISINDNLSQSCFDGNCLVCKENNINICVICKYEYLINENTNGKYKTCFDSGVHITIPIHNEETTYIENNNNFGEYSSTDINLKEENSDKINDNIDLNNNSDLNDNIYQKILNNEFQNQTLTSEQILEVYKKMKDKYLTQDYNGQSQVISTENVIYQISTFEFQKDNEESDISSIDLGECESTLKGIYNLTDNDSLIVFKIDTKSENRKETHVHYEIYKPNDYELLNLSLCNSKIIVNVPINLDDNSIKLYENLKKYGYNIFDSDDDFYNDICTTYTTVNGTDMLIEDRKKDIYYGTGDTSMCQTGCEFVLYNTTTKKSKCDCETQISTNDIGIVEDEFSSKKLASGFLKSITNSNFRVLKCYKLAFNTKELMKNIGRIMMTGIFLSYLISLFCYIFIERKKINTFVKLIIKDKDLAYKSYLTQKSEKNNEKEKSNKNKRKKQKKKDNKKKKSNSKNKNESKKSKKEKIKNSPPKKIEENKIKSKDKLFPSSTRNNLSSSTPFSRQSERKKININIYPINNVNLSNKKNINIKEKSEVEIFKKNKANLINYENLNDQELNSLEYSKAVLLDKRTYFQYYWALLKKKHLILFTILPANDYNLYTLKIALFLLSVSLYLTINGFFFTDSTMHKINEDNGKYDFIYQIPQILYSTIISAIINILLKILSLSEKNILLLKQEKDIIKAKKQSKQIKKCIIIKFVIFFILSNILLLSFWYFISCFCAVYTNTQKILFKDTFISFGLSMLYPFGLNLLPGLFRIPALRDKTQKRKYLYQISGYIALI